VVSQERNRDTESKVLSCQTQTTPAVRTWKY